MSAKTLTEASGSPTVCLWLWLHAQEYERYIEEQSLVSQIKNLTSEWPRVAVRAAMLADVSAYAARYEHLCKTNTTLEQYTTMLKIGALRLPEVGMQMSNEEWARLTLLGY